MIDSRAVMTLSSSFTPLVGSVPGKRLHSEIHSSCGEAEAELIRFGCVARNPACDDCISRNVSRYTVRRGEKVRLVWPEVIELVKKLLPQTN